MSLFDWFKKKPTPPPITVKIMFQKYGEVTLLNPERIPQVGEHLFPNHPPVMERMYTVTDVSIEFITHKGSLGHAQAVEIIGYTIFADPVETAQ